MKLSFLSIVLFFISIPNLSSQCSVVSSNGYTVNISVIPTTINASASCTSGYNFTVGMDYDISFTGSNVPSSLWTLNTVLTCGSFSGLYADLPNSGGTGVATTNISSWNSDTDCATASVSSLGCNSLVVTINGPGIPSQTIDCSLIVAPVEFKAFTVKENINSSIELKWETASEINNNYFEVEKSDDLVNWNTIDKIEGAIDSHVTMHYESTDNSPYFGMNYYRIKQVDIDGRYSYSDIRNIIFDKINNNNISIYPNPAHNKLYIEGNEEELSEVKIFNIYGQHMLNFVNHNTNLPTTISYDVSQLTSGTYLLKTRTETKLFIKD